MPENDSLVAVQDEEPVPGAHVTPPSAAAWRYPADVGALLARKRRLAGDEGAPARASAAASAKPEAGAYTCSADRPVNREYPPTH